MVIAAIQQLSFNALSLASFFPSPVYLERTQSSIDIHDHLIGGREISLPYPAFNFAGFLGALLLRWSVLILILFRDLGLGKPRHGGRTPILAASQ